jgi:16S rRNA (uracil1498-N3)-methyltransferase
VSLPRFFAPDASTSAIVELSRDEAHHLKHVLRLGPGAAVAMLDGRGGEWAGEVASVSGRAVTIARRDPLAPPPEPPIHVTLGVGMLKGDQMDTVVRDATMLGVGAIQPLMSSRVSVPRQRANSGGVDRWRRIALASAKQCRRAVVPAIHTTTPLQSILENNRPPPSPDRQVTLMPGMLMPAMLMFVEPGAHRAASMFSAAGWDRRPSTALVLIGPEGGWSPEELALALNCGAQLCHLGPRTLRAESAPIVALSAIWTAWGWA